MFQQMADGQVATPTDGAAAALEALIETSADLRAAALLGPGGKVLAASSEGDWESGARELWKAAEEADPDPQQVHVATDDGEVFAVRSPGGNSAVGVAQRFALASLMFCDLRAALRELEPADVPAVSRNGA